jgi:hypothetical protein
VFLLSRSDLPEQPDKLAKALEDGLRVFISRPQPMVTVRGDNVRALDAISVDLTGARIDFLRRPARPQLTDTKPALSAGELSVLASSLSIFGSEVAFQLQASDVELNQATQPDNKLLLVVHRAASGSVRIEAARVELERLILRAAAKLAQKQGVTVESVKLELAQSEPRVLEAKVIVAARKLFFHPLLNLSGTVAISEDLVATVSNLNCIGEGPIAALACAAITPQFRRVEQRPFPLSALPLGEVHLRDVALDLANDHITIAASFGERSVLT